MDQTEPYISAKESLWLRVGIVIAACLLVIGLISPMMTMTQLYFFDQSFSVLEGISELLKEGQLFLGIVVFIFSVLLPFLKLILLFILSGQSCQGEVHKRAYTRLHNKMFDLMHDYGRWAMLDVLVVAVLIVSVKLGAIISVEVHWGLYVFSAAILLIMLLTQSLVKLKRRFKVKGS